MFLNFFSKTEAGHVLKMFLQFRLISASRSYKLGSYKRKTCIYLQNKSNRVQTIDAFSLVLIFDYTFVSDSFLSQFWSRTALKHAFNLCVTDGWTDGQTDGRTDG